MELMAFMQKTTNKDGGYTDVLRKHQLNKIILGSWFQFQLFKTICVFEHTKYVTMDIVLVVLELYHN